MRLAGQSQGLSFAICRFPSNALRRFSSHRGTAHASTDSPVFPIPENSYSRSSTVALPSRHLGTRFERTAHNYPSARYKKHRLASGRCLPMKMRRLENIEIHRLFCCHFVFLMPSLSSPCNRRCMAGLSGIDPFPPPPASFFTASLSVLSPHSSLCRPS